MAPAGLGARLVQEPRDGSTAGRGGVGSVRIHRTLQRGSEMRGNATVTIVSSDAESHEQAARAHVERARWWRAKGDGDRARRELSRVTIQRRAAEIKRDLFATDERDTE
jgi:hypothetical protein